MKPVSCDVRRILFFAVAVAGLTACGQQQQPAATKEPTGQIIAKVGTEDVTIHELQNEYRRAGIAPDKVTEQITRAALEEITRRKALVQKAKAAGIDREPTVLLDLLRAREQVLAQAILQRDVQARLSGIGRTEIDRFINANPERFNRRIRFDIDQLSVNAGALRQEFLDVIKDATSLDTIESKAAEAKIAYTRGAGAVYTGDLPGPLVERLRDRKDTDVFFIRSGATGSFFKVRAEAPDPLTGEEAQARAQLLMRNETAQSEVTRKTEEAQITYLGEYAKLMQKPEPAAAPPAGDTPPATPQKQ